MRKLLWITACVLIGALSNAYAGAVAPCAPVTDGENVLPVFGATSIYCISDYGWSNTWLPAGTLAFDSSKDVLGINALNIQYTGMDDSAAGWVSPSMNGGSATPWTVFTPLAYTSASDNQTLSTITDGTLQLQILATMVPIIDYVDIQLTFVNISGNTITGLQLADYFNRLPNGAADPQGLTSYVAGCTGARSPIPYDCIWTTGNQSSSDFLGNGAMGGSLPSSRHTVGTVSTVLNEVATNTYDNANGPVGPGNTAGALQWDLGSLGAGASSDPFDIYLTPEPGTWFLALGGALALAGYRRRWKRG